MAFVDLKRGKLILKVVLAGPPAVGKTERLDQVGAHGRRERIGSRVTGETQLAILPLQTEREGRQVEIEIYEWHGHELADVRARSLFVGLDGVIYIADAREDRLKDSVNVFGYLVERAGKSKIQRLSGLLLVGQLDQGLLRLGLLETKLHGPTWSERLELQLSEAERFVEAVRLFGEVMLARAL